MSVVPKIIADFEVQLATAIAIGGTTFTLSSIIDDDGNTIPDGFYYFTVDNGSTNKEYLGGSSVGGVVSSVVSVSRQAVETSGAVRAHRVGASVIMTDFATYKRYIDAGLNAGAANASTSTQGLLQIPTIAQVNAGTATGSTGAFLAVTPDTLAASNIGQNAMTTAEKTFLDSYMAGIVGVPVPTFSKTAASGFQMYDGSALNRAGTFSTLFGVLVPSFTVTITIATPAVISKTSHGFVAGDRIHFTTTGALPTGLSTATEYFVLSTGLTSNAFEVALSPEGTAINTSGSQSGIHTCFCHSAGGDGGMGDGSTTFGVPNMSGKMVVGGGTNILSLKWEAGAVSTGGDTITIPSYNFPVQGQPVTLTTTGGLPSPLATSTTYYIIRASATTIQFASSLANAIAGVAIDLTTAGSGVGKLTYSNASGVILGYGGGEENHSLAVAELSSHTHTLTTSTLNGGTGNTALGANSAGGPVTTNSTGGNGVHNNMPPYIRANWMAKY